MAYQFAGFFVRPVLSRPRVLPTKAVWRNISAPFKGVGLLLPDFFGQSPPAAEVNALANQLGFHVADSWLYLTYDCWGGAADFVYGLGMRGGVLSEPIEESNWDNVEAAYKSLMALLGVSAEDALLFEPFSPGYWGDN